MKERGVDLVFDLFKCPTDRTAHEIVSALGIKYRDAVITNDAALILFQGCRNVPKELPKYIARR